MTAEELAEELRKANHKMIYFWLYRTEQRRHITATVNAKSVKTTMQRGKGKYK